ncbi:antitoxin Xre/MbcA/ParS toxin-binding domain-containing protein [Marinobacter sp. NP-4(2019)]|uniref:antitoxin Xre/MbcA/ParS toxin-binding domain-containing protein n=1 Tax=Marinobacter sp. NP-4(2019) TaxID=2488665 RepID=UPI0013DF0EED|nr:antitoxin Xre/MbcA/ParS toxin-binding domain-containing protein [Marinobacter sp. NP-4(2019)]
MGNETLSDRISMAGELGLEESELTGAYDAAHLTNEDLEALRSVLAKNMGGDRENMAHWLRTENSQLGAAPLDLVKTHEGFESVVACLERILNR